MAIEGTQSACVIGILAFLPTFPRVPTRYEDATACSTRIWRPLCLPETRHK
jgi:hypothetical protein